MNFNQPNGLRRQYNQPQQPPQQQPAQQQQQQPNFPMLPPQFANLTPQQLQHLKNQPQFQTMMKNYMQRQQQLQQQALRDQSQQPVMDVPQMAAGGVMAGQRNFVNPRTGYRPVPNPAMVQPGAPPVVPGMPAQAGKAPARVGLVSKPGSIVPTIPEVPGVPPEIVSSVHHRNLTSLHEWSEKLKLEGKDVPLDIKLYEDLIEKDVKFLTHIARQSADKKKTMDRLMRDIKLYSDIKQLRMNSISLSAKNQPNNSIWGEGYQGYGNGVSNMVTQLIMPHYSRFTRVPDIMLTERQINERILKRLNSDKKQHLVPIRLDFDLDRDKFKLRDTFLWDLNEDILPIENFVRSLIEDYKFISEQHFYTILSTVKEQIKSYKKIPEKTMGELRIPIKIDITINNTQLVDQFEWDILNSLEGDAEEFCLTMCEEMNLPGEFTTAIAHSIREQSQMFHKALFLIGYSFDGSPIREDEIRSRLLPALRMVSQDHVSGEVIDDFVSILRNPGNVADFTPTLTKLTQLEVERLDKEIERESRRKRRHVDYDSGTGSGNRSTTSRRAAAHAGRGVKVTLPDLSDVPKTFRTPAPSSIFPGGIDLGVPDIYSYNEIMANRGQVKNPEYRAPSADEDYVRYHHDGVLQRFIVKIKVPRR